MLQLTRNYRAENDVDFAEFITDLRIIKMEVNQILKHVVILSAVSLYAGPIKQENLLIINGCRKIKGNKYFVINSFKVFVGLPIICKKNLFKAQSPLKGTQM